MCSSWGKDSVGTDPWKKMDFIRLKQVHILEQSTEAMESLDIYSFYILDFVVMSSWSAWHKMI